VHQLPGATPHASSNTRRDRARARHKQTPTTSAVPQTEAALVPQHRRHTAAATPEALHCSGGASTQQPGGTPGGRRRTWREVPRGAGAASSQQPPPLPCPHPQQPLLPRWRPLPVPRPRPPRTPGARSWRSCSARSLGPRGQCSRCCPCPGGSTPAHARGSAGPRGGQQGQQGRNGVAGAGLLCIGVHVGGKVSLQIHVHACLVPGSSDAVLSADEAGWSVQSSTALCCAV